MVPPPGTDLSLRIDFWSAMTLEPIWGQTGPLSTPTAGLPSQPPGLGACHAKGQMLLWVYKWPWQEPIPLRLSH